MHQLFLLPIFWLVCFNAIAGEGTLQLTADMQVFGWGHSFYYGNDGYFNRYTPSHARLMRGGQ